MSILREPFGNGRGGSLQERRWQCRGDSGITAGAHRQGGRRNVGGVIGPSCQVEVGIAHRGQGERTCRIGNHQIPERLDAADPSVGHGYLLFNPVDIGPDIMGPFYLWWRPQGRVPFTG